MDPVYVPIHIVRGSGAAVEDPDGRLSLGHLGVEGRQCLHRDSHTKEAWNSDGDGSQTQDRMGL